MLVFIEHLTDRQAIVKAESLPVNVVPQRLASACCRKPRDYGSFCSAMQTAAAARKWGRLLDFQGLGNIHRVNAKRSTGQCLPKGSAAPPRVAATTFAPAGASRQARTWRWQ